MRAVISSGNLLSNPRLVQPARKLVWLTTNARQLTSSRRMVARATCKNGPSVSRCDLLGQFVSYAAFTQATEVRSVGSESLKLWWALLCGSLVAVSVSSCDSATTTQQGRDNIALARLNTPFKPSQYANGEYFRRADAERAISAHISDDPIRILVLFGGHNLGKTSVLEHVLAQKSQNGAPRKGVVVVRLDTAKGIDKEVAKAFGGSPDSLRDSRAFVIELCEKFYAEHHYRPVIVFTTTGNNKIVGNDALALAAAIREYSCETHAAVCIANLHDLETAQSFPRDGRTQFVNVSELTREQAEKFLGESLVAELAQKGVTVDQIVSGIGGNPALLNELRYTEDPVAYLRGTVQQASAELQKAIDKHPEHTAGMAALSKAPFETGLSLQDYSTAAGRAVTARDLNSVHKNAVYYDFASKTVKFRTRSLHAAQVLLRGWFS